MNSTRIATNRRPARGLMGHASITCGALLLLTLVGCAAPRENWRDSYARGLIERRNQALPYAPRRYVAAEVTRPDKLMRVADRVVGVIERDARRTAELPAGISYYVDRDLRRWRQNQPVYLSKAAQTLSGKPALIPANAIILFY